MANYVMIYRNKAHLFCLPLHKKSGYLSGIPVLHLGSIQVSQVTSSRTTRKQVFTRVNFSI